MKLGNETDTNNSENNNGLIFGIGIGELRHFVT